VNSKRDQELLCDYAERGSEEAFAELVRRYADFVHSSALRMVGNLDLAREVTQAVFVALSQNARPLSRRAVLSGWLHRTAQNLAAKTVRAEVRRRAREQEAAAMNENAFSEIEPVWERIAPYLDEALGQLKAVDRDVVLLRFFERRSMQEIGRILGLSEAAAQKRVMRGVERLKSIFVARGITASSVLIASALSAHSVTAAPAGLAASLAATALSGGTAGMGTIVAILKLTSMTKLQVGIVGAIVVASVVTPVVIQHQTNARHRAERAALQRQLAEQMSELDRVRGENQQLAKLAENQRLSQPNADGEELARLRRQQSELLRLRGEVGVLRETNQELRELNSAFLRTAFYSKHPGDSNGTVPATVVQEAVQHTAAESRVPPRPINRTFEAGQLQDMGNDSVESAAQTALWAVLNRDRQGFDRIGFVDTNAPPLSDERQADRLNFPAEMLEGVHDVTLQSWKPDPWRDDEATVRFKTAWPDDSQAVDKPAAGSLTLRRLGDAWYLQGFGFQSRGIRPGTKPEAQTGLSY